MPLLQDTPSVDLFLWPFSATMPRVFKSVCLPLQAKQRHNPVLRQYTTGGTPVTASHARMTMTVTGLPHGGRKANFPLICSAALNPSTWRCTPIPLFSFPFRLSMRMPLFPCRHPGRHQVSFSLLGAKVKTGLGTQIFVEKSPRPFRGSILSKKFANPTP